MTLVPGTAYWASRPGFLGPAKIWKRCSSGSPPAAISAALLISRKETSISLTNAFSSGTAPTRIGLTSANHTSLGFGFCGITAAAKYCASTAI